MFDELFTDAIVVIQAWLIVGTIAAGLLAIGVATCRRRGNSVWPPWTFTPLAWRGGDALAVFATYAIITLTLTINLAPLSGRPPSDFVLLAPLGAVPAAWLIAGVLRLQIRETPWRIASRAEWLRAVNLALAGFLIATPAVYAIQFLSLMMMQVMGREIEPHRLLAGPGTAVGGVTLYVMAVCILAPMFEELLCRGLLLRWASARRLNAVLLYMAAAFYALLAGETDGPLGCGLVMVVAVFGLGLESVGKVHRRWPIRTGRGILASSAFFAALHAAVWPTPVPLLALGVALGYVAARSGGLVAPVVLHGIFNAVAVTCVLVL